MKGLTLGESFPMTMDDFNVEIKCHRRGISKVPQPSFLWKHKLRGTIVFMYTRTIEIEVPKGDNHLQGIPSCNRIKVVGRMDSDRIEHINGLLDLMIYEVVV
jgi:hypothetical protein